MFQSHPPGVRAARRPSPPAARRPQPRAKFKPRPRTRGGAPAPAAPRRPSARARWAETRFTKSCLHSYRPPLVPFQKCSQRHAVNKRDHICPASMLHAANPCKQCGSPCCRHVCRALALASRPKCIRALPRPTAALSPTAVRRRGARAAHDEPARPRPTAGRAHSRHGPKRPRRGLSAVVAAAAVAPAPVVSAPPQTSLSSPDSSSSDTVSSSSEDDEADTGSSSSDW